MPGTIGTDIPAAATASRYRKKHAFSKKYCVRIRFAPASTLRLRLSKSAPYLAHPDVSQDNPQLRFRNPPCRATLLPTRQRSHNRQDAVRRFFALSGRHHAKLRCAESPCSTIFQPIRPCPAALPRHKSNELPVEWAARCEPVQQLFRAVPSRTTSAIGHGEE